MLTQPGLVPAVKRNILTPVAVILKWIWQYGQAVPSIAHGTKIFGVIAVKTQQGEVYLATFVLQYFSELLDGATVAVVSRMGLIWRIVQNV
jgi:hypothetical protein